MTLTTLTASITASARTVDKLAGGVEALALAAVTRAAGWVACVPTIALTARSCEVIFSLAPQTAVASAIALELIGQSVTANWLRAKEWNKAKGAKSPPASEWLALAMVVGYFATDFILIAALQAPKAMVEPVYWTALLFPLAQVISTLVMGQRVMQFRREADAEAEREKRSRSAKEGAVTRALRKAEAEAEAQLAQETVELPPAIALPTFTERQLAQIERVVAVYTENEMATLRDLQTDGLIGSATTASRARQRAIAGGYLDQTVRGFSPNGHNCLTETQGVV